MTSRAPEIDPESFVFSIGGDRYANTDDFDSAMRNIETSGFESEVNHKIRNRSEPSSGEIFLTDCITTRLEVRHHTYSTIPDYQWEDRILKFHTSNGRQVLYISIDSPQKYDNSPRFHLDHIGAINRIWIDKVFYSKDTNPTLPNDWHEHDIKKKFPPHTRHIKLILKLPGTGDPTSFKLRVYARDRKRNSPVDCDPQVGNDPPKSDLSPANAI